MRLQRYPDGANASTLFIWGRHPKASRTWTHSLTLTRQRPESGQSRFAAYSMPRLLPGGQSRYGVVAFGIALELATQAARAFTDDSMTKDGIRETTLREIEDMHERAWARECERGNLDKAAWHLECAKHMRVLIAARETTHD